MFGPNTHLSRTFQIAYHHRSASFRSAYQAVEECFLEVLGTHRFHLLFVPGSATSGMETLLLSVSDELRAVGKRGKFTERWSDLCEFSNMLRDGRSSGTVTDVWCQVETSLNIVQSFDRGIVDSVCAFPFFDVPRDAEAFITCTNKLVGSIPGLAVIGLAEPALNRLSDTRGSTNHLLHFLEASKRRELPYTAPTHIFDDLLTYFGQPYVSGLRQLVEERRELLMGLFSQDELIGDETSPLLTVKKSAISSHLAQRWDLYSKSFPEPCYQIFLYSAGSADYSLFASEVHRER